ncbi:MAG: transcriptional regulator, DeoR family [Eubacterium sp.]|jgi:DeoR/GlpR family transcriptional regulator of sugar metabolism|nr:transcriptional regulator, DeoR family [Eubacterium sp.]
MFAIERIRIIKNYLLENKQVEVNQLSQMLGVSEVTIRRDLEKLEGEEFLTRTHGGAVLGSVREATSDGAEADLFQDHYEISKIAIKMINDGDVIMLTNGPINLEIARQLSSKNRVTVLTNDLNIASHILEAQSAKVVLLGGDIDYNTKAVFGTLTINNLNNFYVNRLFIEVDGISNNLDLTVSNIDMAAFIKAAAQNANERIIVCTSAGFERNSFYRAGLITDLCDKLITNHTLSDQHKNNIFKANIQLFTSIDLFEGRV